MALKPPSQRAEENARYRALQNAVGIAKVTVMVPADRVPELRAIALHWRQDSKQLLESDRPSADQILQIHAVSRTLDIRLPVHAFETRSSAALWLLAHEKALGAKLPHRPRVRLRGP